MDKSTLRNPPRNKRFCLSSEEMMEKSQYIAEKLKNK
jgi:hypothetical protein